MGLHHQPEVQSVHPPSLFQAIEPVPHPGSQDSDSSRFFIYAGSALYRISEPCSCIYQILTGFFKITGERANGGKQVLSFQLPQDIIGIDGIGEGQHCQNAIALQDSVVVRISLHRLKMESEATSNLRHDIYAHMREEIIRQHDAIFALGSLDARSKVAAFILHLSNRFNKIGYSKTQFNFFMTRYDIASYLGLANETLSRIFTQLEQEGIIKVDYRKLTILDRQSLESFIAADKRK